MAYFPMFTDLEGKNVLIIGGGTVALRKCEKLKDYGARITVAAPEIMPELVKMSDAQINAEFTSDMLAERDMVIAATNKRAVNAEAARLCRERGIPINVVDDKELCSFIFPSLIKHGALSIGISTAGSSPSAAVWIKERVTELLPENIEEILAYLEALRPEVAKRIVGEESARARVYKELLSRCIARGTPLSEEETQEYLNSECGK